MRIRNSLIKKIFHILMDILLGEHTHQANSNKALIIILAF